MVVWASLAAARRCLNGESSGKYEVLLSFEDRELAYQDSYSELKGAWAACRLRGFINITDRSELPRRLRKWHWSAIARAKRAARAKSVAAARRVNGRPTTVKGKRHASVRAAAASAKAGLGAFARKAAKRRRAD